MTSCEQIKIILKNEPEDVINRFLIEFKKLRPVTVDYKYRDLQSEEIKGNKKALRNLLEVQSLQYSGVITVIDPHLLNDSIERIEFFLKLNNSLNTGGRAVDLTVGEIATLVQLKKVFIDVLPTKSTEFTEDTLLYQIGAVLIDKPISKNVNKLIVKSCDAFL